MAKTTYRKPHRSDERKISTDYKDYKTLKDFPAGICVRERNTNWVSLIK